jgi:hypothetical protein
MDLSGMATLRACEPDNVTAIASMELGRLNMDRALTQLNY